MPGFRVFSMMNNKLVYFLVQCSSNYIILCILYFFLPLFTHDASESLWCCGFSSDLLDAPCCGSLFCLSLSVSKFAAGSVSDKGCYWAHFVSTWCLCKAIPCSCVLCPLLNFLCSSLVKFIPHVFWWPLFVVLSAKVFIGFCPSFVLSPSPTPTPSFSSCLLDRLSSNMKFP